MTISDFVQVSVSISASSSPTVQGLSTPLIATYHTHYSDIVRVYSAATMLTQMVTDGFSVGEAAYKAATAILSAPNAPSQVCIGRRVNVPLQTLQLSCVDGTVAHSYNFTVKGSDGVSHAIVYTNVASPGPVIPATALTGTVTATQGSTAITFTAAQTLAAGSQLTFSGQPGVAYTLAAAVSAATTATLTTVFTGATASGQTATPGATTAVTSGSTAVTFSQAQTLAKGTLLMFGTQPGVYYVLSAAISAATAGVLTVAYSGATAAAATTTYLGVLSGTLSVVNGSAIVPTTATQVGTVYPGDSVQFSSQPGTYYTVLTVSASQIVLTQIYSGVTAGTANASLVCQASNAASQIQALLAPIVRIGTPSVITTPQIGSTGLPANYGAAATVQLSRTDGFLTDIQSWLTNGFANIVMLNATADPGIAADLSAMQRANNSAWYGLVLDSNSAAEVEAAAAWAEATLVGGKVLFADNSDWQNTQTAVTTDLFSVLQTDAYNRTVCIQNDQQLLSYTGAGICGQVLAMNPGSYTLAYKTLPGVPADTDTTLTEAQAMALNSMTAATPGPGAKNGNYYKTVAGQNWLFPGTAPSGRFFDLTLGIDWLQTRMQAAVAAAIAGLPKLPFTDIGIGAIKDAINSILRLGSTPQYGLILPDGQDPLRPISVTVPTAASLTSAQRATRNVPGISFSAGIQGAIETTTVQGTLIP